MNPLMPLAARSARTASYPFKTAIITLVVVASTCFVSLAAPALAENAVTPTQALLQDEDTAIAIPHAGSLTSIVLVHGAFVDASIWTEVILLLQDAGFRPSAVELPMTSLAADVKATRQVLERNSGPILLVGYSWGGMPVTEAGTDPRVKGLVYIAAMAPDAGQSINDLFDRSAPNLPGQAAVEESNDGLFWLRPDGFAMALAHDAPVVRTRVLAVSQRPIAVAAFGEPVAAAAWHDKPSWFAVSADDKIVPTDLQRRMAKTIGATIIELPTAHASLLSRPHAIAAFIARAANSFND